MRRLPSRPLALALALAAAGACEDAVPPTRTQHYPIEDPQNGLTFHWTRAQLPVRYWVADDAGAVRTFVEDAVRLWAATFVHGEYRAVMVADSAVADVLVFVDPGTPPAAGQTDDPPVVGACSGVTRYALEDGEDRLRRPFRVTVDWDDSYQPGDIVNCLERVTVHEIGHTLGLFGHSADEEDLMYPSPRVREPSPGDRSTLEILYHSAATIAPPAGD